MAAITTRQTSGTGATVAGVPLTNTQLDTNFININTEIHVDNYPATLPSLNLDFANSKQLDPRIAFTRTSPATYYDGKTVVKAEENLLTRSQEFDNAAWTATNSSVNPNLLTWSEQFDNAAWTKSNSFVQTNLLTWSEQFDNAVWTKLALGSGSVPVVTANASIAPDGTTTADRAQFNCGGNLSSDRSFLLQSGLTGISLGQSYVGSVWVKANTPSEVGKQLRLAADGILTSVVITIPADWQRFTFSGTCTTTTGNNFILETRGANTTNQTADVLIWGAQLVQGSVPGDYQVTTSAAAAVQYTDPFGNKTAEKLVENTANSNHPLYREIGVVAGSTYTYSLYVKAGERTQLSVVRTNTPFDSFNHFYDLAAGTASGGGSIISVGSGWFRISGPMTASTSGNAGPFIQIRDAFGFQTYTGDGTSGIYIWGAQLVQGSSPGTYQLTTSTAATTSPDGSTGYLIVDNATSGGHFISQPVQVFVNYDFTLSCYAKAGTAARLWLSLDDAGNRGVAAVYNLSTGQVTATNWRTSSIVTASSITSVGNGWYRCVLSGMVTDSGANSFKIGFSDVDIPTFGGGNLVTYTGAGSTLNIWGAQFEQRSSPTVYTPTTTTVVTNYMSRLLTAQDGIPRFDHDPITEESLGWLLEPQRTNLLLYSEQFNQAPWSNGRSNCTVVTNVTVAPDGTISADYVSPSAAGSTGIDYRGNTGTSGTTYTASIYVKPATSLVRVNLLVDVAFQQGATTFDLIGNGSVVSGTGLIKPVGNGWYRLSTYATLNQTRADVGITFTATNTNTGFFVWGAQLEVGQFPTSYISTAASQTTRSPETGIISGTNFLSWYNYSEGTQYVEARSDWVIPGGLGFIYSGLGPEFYETNQVNTWVISYYRQTSATTINMNVSSQGYGPAYGGSNTGAGMSVSGVAANTTTNSRFWKAAAAQQSGNSAFYLNTTSGIGSVTNSTAFSTPRPIALGFATNNLIYANFSGHIKKFAYYPRRLSNTELQTLVT
jgi:hypothetical protein